MITHDHNRILGLSPRVRGNQKLVMDRVNNYRSIPACAGEPGRECLLHIL